MGSERDAEPISYRRKLLNAIINVLCAINRNTGVRNIDRYRKKSDYHINNHGLY